MTPENAGKRTAIPLGRGVPDRVVLAYSINIATFFVNVKRENEKKIRFYHRKMRGAVSSGKSGPDRINRKSPGRDREKCGGKPGDVGMIPQDLRRSGHWLSSSFLYSAYFFAASWLPVSKSVAAFSGKVRSSVAKRTSPFRKLR